MKDWIQHTVGAMKNSVKFMAKVRKNIESLRAEGQTGQADDEAKQLVKMEKLHEGLRKDLEKMKKMEAKR